MKTKCWIFIICTLLILCIGLSVFLLWPREASTHAEIVSDGKVLYTVDLRIDQQLQIATEDGGINMVTIQDGKIAVTEANCPDHYCMKRGYCNNGAQIVCLPNRLVIRFVGIQEIDAVVG